MTDIDYIYTGSLPNTDANSVHVCHFSEALSSEFNFNLYSFSNKKITDIHEFYYTKEKFPIKKLSGNKYLAILYLVFTNKLKKNIYTRDFFCALILALCGKRVVWESHIVESRLIYTLAYKIVSTLNLFFKVVVITNSLRDKMSKHIDIKSIIVLPDGCRLQKNQTTHKHKKTLVIGYAGSFYKGKGVETVIELAKSMQEHKFIIAGGRPDQVNKFEKAKIDNLKFVGHLNQKDLASFYSRLDIALLPNHPSVRIKDDGQEIGDVTSPLKLFEYFSFGVPIVSSNLPVLREILNDKNSVLVRYDDINEWINAINLLEDSNLRKSLSSKGLDEIKDKYSWNVRAKKIHELLKISE